LLNGITAAAPSATRASDTGSSAMPAPAATITATACARGDSCITRGRKPACRHSSRKCAANAGAASADTATRPSPASSLSANARRSASRCPRGTNAASGSRLHARNRTPGAGSVGFKPTKPPSSAPPANAVSCSAGDASRIESCTSGCRSRNTRSTSTNRGLSTALTNPSRSRDVSPAACRRAASPARVRSASTCRVPS